MGSYGLSSFSNFGNLVYFPTNLFSNPTSTGRTPDIEEGLEMKEVRKGTPSSVQDAMKEGSSSLSGYNWESELFGNSSSIARLDSDKKIDKTDEASDRSGSESGAVVSVTPKKLKVPGGCCMGLHITKQAMVAMLVQTISTTLTYGTKPLVEAAVLMALGVSSTAAVPLTAAIVAAFAGGAYVGIVHTFAGQLVSGYINSALGGTTFKERPDSARVLGEIATVDIPVIAAFTATWSPRGDLMERLGETDVGLDAASKLIADIAAGPLQGLITYAMRLTMAKFKVVYKEEPSASLKGKKLQFFVDTFHKTLNPKKMTGREAGHGLLGKVVGAMAGSAVPLLLRMMNGGAAEKGAIGMVMFCIVWFAGIHGTEKLVDTLLAKPQDTPPGFTPKFDEREVSSESGSSSFGSGSSSGGQVRPIVFDPVTGLTATAPEQMV